MSHYLHLLGLVFLISPLLISASKIDNKILGLPVVQCVNGAITFNFETEKPFAGRAYVRGLEDDANCTQRFSQSNSSLTNQTRFSLSVKRGQCNMDRQRTPEGVAHSVMVIVAFHPVFETKNDIAFRGVCFFRTAMKIAGSLHGVAGSMSVVVENNGRPPTQPFTADCTYTIRGATADGPSVHYAQVGDMLHHVWECSIGRKQKQQYKKAKALGILVHSCVVEDGRGGAYRLLDEKGCPLDAAIGLSEPEYENGTASVPSNVYRAVSQLWAYKFSRTSELRFKCVVAICDRRQDQCEAVTPPKCGNQTEDNSIVKDGSRLEGLRQLDVMTSIHVLDNFDEQLGEGGIPSSFFQRLNDNAGKRPARCVAARCSKDQRPVLW